MDESQHICAAVQHLLAAMTGREEVDHAGIKGAPLVEFDSGGQAMFSKCKQIVMDERSIINKLKQAHG